MYDVLFDIGQPIPFCLVVMYLIRFNVFGLAFAFELLMDVWNMRLDIDQCGLCL